MERRKPKTATAQAKPAKALRMQLVIDPELVDRVDEWRGQQPGVPNRSRAIRMLVERALSST